MTNVTGEKVRSDRAPQAARAHHRQENERRRTVLPVRREPRFESDLAVELQGGSARARNVSASGIYLETGMPLRKGADLRFTVQFAPIEGAPLRMQCRARVVRVERLVGRFGVGATIQQFDFARERKAADGTG